MGDPWEDPRTRAWARDFEHRVVPAMRESSVVAPVWTGTVDAKLAAEIGASVLLDKPLIAVVQSGTAAPDKLVRIADRILEADLTTAAGRASLSRRIRDAITELTVDRGAHG